MQKKAAKKFQDGVMELLADGTAHLFDAVSFTITLVIYPLFVVFILTAECLNFASSCSRICNCFAI